MIGYKAFDKDLKCRGFQFEVGKTYRKENTSDIHCCTNTVFHFCREINKIEIESTYKLAESRVCEVIAIGNIVKDADKYGTDELLILRELSREEIKEYNNHNSGSRNSGDFNSGSFNSGDHNSGNFNSGDHNSGNFNSGSFNSGNFNSGNFNSGNNLSGIFMSRRINYEAFNRNLTKKEFEAIITSEGYRICCRFKLFKFRIRKNKKSVYWQFMSYKQSWAVFWNSLNFRERNAVRKIPFMDKEVFFEITGIKL